jgi:hypothetical protein
MAEAGDRYPAALVVSVSDETGKPVVGLAATSFNVQAVIVAPGGTGVGLAGVTSRADGVYTLDIVPDPTAGDWGRGQYLLAVTVVRGFDHGQCLAELVI